MNTSWENIKVLMDAEEILKEGYFHLDGDDDLRRDIYAIRSEIESMAIHLMRRDGYMRMLVDLRSVCFQTWVSQEELIFPR